MHADVIHTSRNVRVIADGLERQTGFLRRNLAEAPSDVRAAADELAADARRFAERARRLQHLLEAQRFAGVGE